MATDPPYGVNYDPSRRARRGLGAGELAQGKVLNDDRADWREAYALFPGDTAYVWHGALHGDVVGAGLAACGFQLRAQIVWAKQHFTLGRGDYITVPDMGGIDPSSKNRPAHNSAAKRGAK